MAISASVTTAQSPLDASPETELSRRYLRILLKWIPYGMRQFNSWPGRPRCGHFFGGVLWYCQDTVMPALALAAATRSSEYDASIAGHSREEIEEAAIQALRYAGFTHDSGPADCVRPTESWGRMEPAGKKWGERGAGFFRETNAGRQVANLSAVGFLLKPLLGEEEIDLVAAVTRDYLGRIIDRPPASGQYFDTQMEENAWTAFGLTGAAFYHDRDPEFSNWQEKIKRWMFLTVSKPEDMYNFSEAYSGRSVRAVTGRIFTTLPDNTAENHGFVHPSYMKSCLTLVGQMTVLYRLWGREIPAAATHGHQVIYNVLKRWVDDTGSCHAPQGMDWPYLAMTSHCVAHGMANLNLGDPDGALLERRSLTVLEEMVERQNGELIHEQTKRYCHGQQDPAIMRERFISHIAYLYLAHRLAGDGATPSNGDEFAESIRGVQTFPQGGAVVHTHPAGRTSFAWRNGSMALPATRAGIRLVGFARNSVLARLEGVDASAGFELRDIRVRDGVDRVAVLLVEDLHQGAIRRRACFASLPNGESVIFEHLEALRPVTVESVTFGYLSIMNDPRFWPDPRTRPTRTVSWSGGTHIAEGYAAGDASEDRDIDLSGSTWVNVDDALGIVFEADGEPVYRDIHHYPVWHATENELILGRSVGAKQYRPGEEIGKHVLLWVPEQHRDGTAATVLRVHEASRTAFVARVAVPAETGDGSHRRSASAVVAANFGESELPISLPEGGTLDVGSVRIDASFRGTSGTEVGLAPLEPLIVLADEYSL